jgi:cell wall-associated NlpC family hydrolase
VGGPQPAASAAATVATKATPRKLIRADVMVVAQKALPAKDVARVARLRGVQAARPVDAARVRVNGTFAAVLGVDPDTFRAFAAGPTAASSSLWRNVANGAIAVSYTMGKQDRLPLGGTVKVAGRTMQSLRVAGFGTVGIGGVDAVISRAQARTLGFPAGNAIVVSAPHERVAALVRQIKSRMPRGAVVESLVTTSAQGTPAAAGVAGSSLAAGTVASANGRTALSTAELVAMLKAAASRVGYPYVWGGSGPTTFDCSGLVQWSFARAGVVMPRVAADQARTGPAIPVSQAQAGDLLFYRTDPTAPDYISHVAIYLGKGLMIQAPEPGEDVQIVPVALGSEFAGVVRVSPAIAAQVAAAPMG